MKGFWPPVSRPLLGLLGAALVAAGCGDHDITGTVSRPTIGQPALARHPSAARLSVTSSFWYEPSTGAKATLAGSHRIVFEPRSVCDPASTYGPTEWEQPCAPATERIRVTAVSWVDALGHPRVDFSPALRFVPDRRVVLFMKDWLAAEDAGAVIEWCGDDGVCVDESLTDPTLRTYRLRNGFLYRRIKHFSGYNVAAGRTDVF